MQQIIERLRAEWRALEGAIGYLTRQITAIARTDAACQRLVEIPRCALSATALVAAVGKGTTFRNRRSFCFCAHDGRVRFWTGRWSMSTAAPRFY
jgi:transposase